MATGKRARRNSPLYLPGAFDLFEPSKTLVLKNIWIFGPLYAIPFILWLHTWIWAPTPGASEHHWWRDAGSIGPGWPGSPLPTYPSHLFIGFSLFWLLFVIIAGTIAQIMAQTAQLEAAEHKTPAFDKLWPTVKEIAWRMLGLYIVTGILIAVGLVLFIIPGLILIRRYLLAPYVMIDKKVGIFEAMQRSANLSRINTGSIWGIMGVMFLIALLNIIPIIGNLLSFIFGVLYSVAPALRYTQLKKLA